MDVTNNVVEKNSLNLRRVFAHYFDWNNMDVTYSKVDLINKCIYVMPSNYEWHLLSFQSLLI